MKLYQGFKKKQADRKKRQFENAAMKSAGLQPRKGLEGCVSTCGGLSSHDASDPKGLRIGAGAAAEPRKARFPGLRTGNAPKFF
jgi:hypothetical protein